MNIFTRHPKEVGLTYFGHLLFAFSVVGSLIAAVFCCTVHAFFPFIFTHTTSGIIKRLNEKLEHRQG